MLAEMMCLRAKLYCMFKGRIMKGTDKQKRKNGTEACIWVFAHAILVRSFIELGNGRGWGGLPYLCFNQICKNNQCNC